MEQNRLGKRINEVRRDRCLTAEKLSELCNINLILHKPLCVDDQKLVHNNPHQSGEPPLDELHREFQCSQQDAEIPHRLVPERDDS